MAKNDEFFIHVSDAEKNLHMTRKERITGTVLSPCCMGAEDVEYEMQNGKNTEMLSICGMNQEGLEYFAQHYAGTYRYLNFFKCQLISDFHPWRTCQNWSGWTTTGISGQNGSGIFPATLPCVNCG